MSSAGRGEPAPLAGQAVAALDVAPDVVEHRAVTGLSGSAPWDEPGLWTERGDVAVRGGHLHYAALGEGPPLVLLPKLGGRLTEWRHIAPLLAASHRIVAVDPPGHGGSRMEVPVPFAQAVEDSATLLLELLDALRLEAAVLGGNSLGGCISLAAASLAPDRARGVVLVSCALGPAEPFEEVERLAHQPDPAFDADGLPIRRDLDAQGPLIGTSGRDVNDEMNATRALAGLWIRPSQRGVALADFHAMLERVTSPVLLVYGEHDPLARFEAPALPHISRASSARVPGAGRFPHQENAQGTAEVLAGFLAGCRPRDT